MISTLSFADAPSRVEVNEHLLEPVDSARSRTVPIKLYIPSTASESSPAPVILFSHGLGGSRMNSVYLGRHWAEAGYIGVFMQHIGSDESVWKGVPAREVMTALRNAASGPSLKDRQGDVPFVIDRLAQWQQEEGHPLKGKMDLEHIGMSGHSFGAVTSQDMMGRKYPFNRSFADPRLDAFLLMSPSLSRGSTAERQFSHIAAPVLCMTGTKDDSPIDPNRSTPDSRREVYRALPIGDKFELVFKDGEHHAFSDATARGRGPRLPHHHGAIQKISTEFWNAYLRDDQKSKSWLQSSSVEHDAGLIDGDVWQWK
ncbi:alpha/beta hydrolase family protein [Neorhodopirellula pilleata]|uniref:alpha/beta hydrolase family protein n=1 Tax=Neorhodopirellula pilleata TaxID=2714738 RepID=UPI0011B65ECE|nr:acetylhydrolase [Neorhodopirellula pilleata]